MAYDYNPDDKFGSKDLLPEGHPEKIIRGVEFDEEFLKIEEASNYLQDRIVVLEGISANLQTGVPEAPSDSVIYGRMNATWVPVPSGGGGTGTVTWANVQSKPSPIKMLGGEDTPLNKSFITGGDY